MSSFPGASSTPFGNGSRRQKVQIQLVGLVDGKAAHERLLQACKGICGKPETKLLHRETVYKLAPPAPGVAPPRVSYELRLRLVKTASSDSDKLVQPMAMFCLGEAVSFPAQCEKYLQSRVDENSRRRTQKPGIRRMVEVDVSNACDDVLKLLGFETSYIFIRSGQSFSVGVDNRTTITISELHRLQSNSQPPKFETDRAGAPVDDAWMVELVTCGDADTPAGVEGSIKEHLGIADQLGSYVTFNTPEPPMGPWGGGPGPGGGAGR